MFATKSQLCINKARNTAHISATHLDIDLHVHLTLQHEECNIIGNASVRVPPPPICQAKEEVLDPPEAKDSARPRCW